MEEKINVKKSKIIKDLITLFVVIIIGSTIILAPMIPKITFGNPLKRMIKRESTTIYEREELALPAEFRSICFNSNDMLWVGWHNDDYVDYYCLSGSTKFSHSFSHLEKNDSITMKVELVFTEEDWLNNRIPGYATFYSSDRFYDPISHYRVYVSVHGDVVRSSGVSSMHYRGRIDDRFRSLSSIFMREMIVSFDNFLKEKNIKDFHNV